MNNVLQHQKEHHMRTTIISVILGLAFVTGCSRDQSEELNRVKQENADLRAFAAPPPAQLDSLYPPIAPAPLYQIKMFEMANPFSGFILKMNEGDREGAKVLFESFRKHYSELSGLVPEWKKSFPMAPLDELERLIGQGEPGKVMEAVGNVDMICQECHVSNLPKVQYRYHWQDFSTISLSDPVTKQDLAFKRFMLTLELSMVGIEIEAQNGNLEGARKHFDNFRNRFTELKNACQACHESERKYFVDSEIDDLLDNLGKALKSSKPDPAAVAGLGQRIGMESCGKCHLVHLPAAYAKNRWMMAQKETM